MFVVGIEGIDGSGKTSLIKGLKDCFVKRNCLHKVVFYSFPSEGKTGRKARNLLNNFASDYDIAVAFALDFSNFFTNKLLKIPDDSIVILDRSVWSFHSYQKELLATEQFAKVLSIIKNVRLDYVFLLDISAKKACQRLTGKKDKMEARGVGFFERVRGNFLALARNNCFCTEIVSGDANIDIIVTKCFNKILDLTNIVYKKHEKADKHL